MPQHSYRGGRRSRRRLSRRRSSRRRLRRWSPFRKMQEAKPKRDNQQVFWKNTYGEGTGETKNSGKHLRFLGTHNVSYDPVKVQECVSRCTEQCEGSFLEK